MKKLFKIQEAFLKSLDRKEVPTNWAKENALQTCEERIAAYRDSCRYRFLNCLTEDYPVTSKILGEERFESLAFQFNKTHPSASFSIDLYGKNFSDFLKTKLPKNEAFLVELAKFEWKLCEAFLARDENGLTEIELKILLKKNNPHISLKLCEHVCILSSPWPLSNIYEEEKRLAKNPCHYVFYRKDFQSHYAQIDNWEFLVLEALQREQSLDIAFASIPESDIPSAEEVQESFSKWSERGLFSIGEKANTSKRHRSQGTKLPENGSHRTSSKK